MQEQSGEISLLYITLKRSTIIWTFFYAVSGHCKTSIYFVKEVDFNIRLSESIYSVIVGAQIRILTSRIK